MKKWNPKRLIGKTITTGSCSYVVKQLIAKGGNSYVYKVESNGVFYACKIYKTNNRRNTSEINFQEACNHQYIVKIIEHGLYNTKLFCIMPLYEKNFKNIMYDGNTTFLSKIKYFLQICEALKYSHNNKIIHRDIKPQNFLYDKKEDKVLLSDFGIAHFDGNGFTKSQDKLANFEYASPEQKNHRKSKIQKQSDIYSMGLILNEIFTKKIPNGDYYKKIKESHPRFSYMDDIVSRMLISNPKTREKNIQKVINFINLGRFVAGENEEYINYGLEIYGPHKEDIFKMAKFDVMMANEALQNDTNLDDYALDYHSNIVYLANKFISDSYKLVRIYEYSLSKMFYESNTEVANSYNRNDLASQDTINLVYSKICKLNRYGSTASISKKIMKIVKNVKNYHALEIAKEIDHIEKIILIANIVYAIRILNELIEYDIISRTYADIQSFFKVNSFMSRKEIIGKRLFDTNSSNIISKIAKIEEKNLDFTIERFDAEYYIVFNSNVSKNNLKKLLKKYVEKLPERNVEKLDAQNILDEIEVSNDSFVSLSTSYDIIVLERVTCGYKIIKYGN